MKWLFLSLFLLSIALFAYKPLPPGAGVSVKPNVLFVIDTSGSMLGCEGSSCCNQSWCHSNNKNTRIEDTREALTMLMNDAGISSSVRPGLTWFPNKNPSNMLTVPSRDTTDIAPGTNQLHINVMKHEISLLVAGGGTPLTDAINKAKKYFKGTAGTDVCKPAAYGYYNAAACNTPIIDKCQKNYIILFTDGEPNGSKKNVADAAYAAYNFGLAGTTASNGDALVDTRLLVYAIAFGSDTNVDYIASGTHSGSDRILGTADDTYYNSDGGGTEHGYTASNSVELKTAFDKIIADIGAKNITSTSPTLIPGFAGPENDVVYLTNFQPRASKQWSGHLFKYRLTTSGANILDGVPKWDLSTQLASQIGSRTIKTICKDKDGNKVTDFTLGNAEAIAFCMLQSASGGAGNPMIAGIKQTFPPGPEVVGCSGAGWQNHKNEVTHVVDGCTPTREWIDPVCLGSESIVDMIDGEYSAYQNICYFSDFEDYAVGVGILPPGTPLDCSDGDTFYPGYGTLTRRDKARFIQRYLCQHNNTFCGCYSRWEGSLANGQPSTGKARPCSQNTDCGGTVALDEPRIPAEPSCYFGSPDDPDPIGYCVGPAIDYSNESVWEEQTMPNYKNGLNSVLDINKPGTGTVYLTLKDLTFSNSTSEANLVNWFSDYLAVKEFRSDGNNVVHIFTTDNNNGNIEYRCPESALLSAVGSSPIHLDIGNGKCIPYPAIDKKYEFPDSSVPEGINTTRVKLTFHSSTNNNDIAFILSSYQTQPQDITNYRWAFSGDENESAGRDALSVDDVKLTGRLIDFISGYDSFEEDTATKCAYNNDGTRNGACEKRKFPLADIYNSRVKYIGTPSQMYTYSGYRLFQAQNVKPISESIILFGANDGLLHAINPDDNTIAGGGGEVWSFVPPTLLAKLKEIVGNDSYNQTVSQFLLDSSVKVMDVCDAADCSDSKDNWKRVLVMGFGEAQEAIMALDITILDSPKFLWAILNETPRIFKSPLFNDLDNCEQFRRVLRWDKDGNIFAYSNLADKMNPNQDLVHDRSDHIKKTDLILDDYPQYDYSRLGKTWSEPVVAQIGGTDSSTGKFVAVIGGGGNYPYKSSNPNEAEDGDNSNCYDSNLVFGSSVYIIDVMNDGKILTRYDIPASSNNIPERIPARVSILPKPQKAGISGIQNRIMAQIYTADMSGRVWRLTVNDNDIATNGKVITCSDSTNTLECLKLYDNHSTTSHKDYIFKSVAITHDGKTSNVGNASIEDDTSVWVYTGTGDVSLDGIKDNSGTNVLLAIKDHTWEVSDTAGQSVGKTQVTSLRTLDENVEADPTKCSKIDYKDSLGWKYNLPSNQKLVGKPVIVDNYVYFTVYEHGVASAGNNECSGHLGTSWLYSFKLFSGCHNSAFDTLGDGTTSNPNANKYKAKLGKGIATAPVLRGNTMYFGISGEADPNDGDPILGQGQRDENIIRWERPNGNNADSNKSSSVPFAYFNEVY